MPKLHLTKQQIGQISPAASDVLYWDTKIPCFGLRVKPSGVMSFVLQYRDQRGQSKRLTLGKLGAVTPEQARKAAREKLAQVHLGGNPAADRQKQRNTPTIALICEEYLEAGQRGDLITRKGKPKAASTLATDESRIERHIKPILGKLLASDVERADVHRLFQAVKRGETARDEKGPKPRSRITVTGGAGTAKKAVQLLSAIYNYAIERGYELENPARGYRLPADQRREVRDPEKLLVALGRALLIAERDGAAWQAIDTLRLLALTGLRLTEATTLQWQAIDFKTGTLTLEDSKTGRSTRVLSLHALSLLGQIGQQSIVSEPFGHEFRDIVPSHFAWRSTNFPRQGYVFPAPRGSQRGYAGLPGAVRRIRVAETLAAADREVLADFSSHKLRHALATVAETLQMTEATIGALLGHRNGGVTAGYIGRVDRWLRKEANRLGFRIEALLRTREEDVFGEYRLGLAVDENQPEIINDEDLVRIAW